MRFASSFSMPLVGVVVVVCSACGGSVASGVEDAAVDSAVATPPVDVGAGSLDASPRPRGDSGTETVDASAIFAVSDPETWFRAGTGSVEEYAVGVDTDVAHDGHGSGHVGSRGTASAARFTTFMKSLDGRAFQGKRVRMSAFIKSDIAKRGWAGMWMRADASGGDVVAFDNMETRPIVGVHDWTRYEVVLDIPTSTVSVSFGLLLAGTGDAWIGDVTFEEVDHSVPTTDAP